MAASFTVGLGFLGYHLQGVSHLPSPCPLLLFPPLPSLLPPPFFSQTSTEPFLSARPCQAQVLAWDMVDEQVDLACAETKASPGWSVTLK